MDGPRLWSTHTHDGELHNQQQQNDGAHYADDVVLARDELKECVTEFDELTVISRARAKDTREINRRLKDMKERIYGFMQTKNIDDISTRNSKIQKIVSRRIRPMNAENLAEILQKHPRFRGDRRGANEIAAWCFENRGYVETETIKYTPSSSLTASSIASASSSSSTRVHVEEKMGGRRRGGLGRDDLR